MEYVTMHNSVQVQMSPLEPETGDADEWKLSPVLEDEVEVSEYMYTMIKIS